MNRDDWNQIRALLYKEYLVHKKNLLTSLVVEIGIPLVLCLAFLVCLPFSLKTRLDKAIEEKQFLRTARASNLTVLFGELLLPFRDDRVVYYSPATERTIKWMNISQEMFKQLDSTVSFEPMPIEEMQKINRDLEDVGSILTFRKPLATITFQDGDPNSLSYVIRPTLFPSSSQLFINDDQTSAAFETIIRHLLPSPYVVSGFLFLQMFINLAFTYEILGEEATSAAVVALPQHEVHLLDDPLLISPLVFFSSIYILALLPMVILVKQILDEKSSKITELMRLMTMRDFNYWISKWIWYTLYFLVTSILVTCFILFTATDRLGFVLCFLVILLYCLSSMFMASSLTVFFTRPVVGVAFYVTLQVLSTKPLWRFIQKPGLSDREIFQGDLELPELVHYLFCVLLTPNYALSLLILMLIEGAGYKRSSHYVPSLGAYSAEFKNLFRVPPQYAILSYGLILTSFIVAALLWLLLLWYLGQVLPTTGSPTRPFYFPFVYRQSFEKGSSKSNSKKVEAATSGLYFEHPPEELEIGLSLRNVTKQFEKRTAVKNVNLNVYIGQITILLGHNGAGKTTLMEMICGNLKPSKGMIFVAGVNIRKNTPKARRRMGYCPQQIILYNDLTVEEHLWLFGYLKGFSKKQMKVEVTRVLRLLKLESKRTARARMLSGGMKKKLQIAGAIIGKSNILILDEPSSGLDIEARRLIWDLLLALRKDYLILLTTHHMEEADCLGDRIAIMQNGEIRCCGSANFLKHTFGVGYNLTVVKSDKSENIQDFILSVVKLASVTNETNNEISFNIPQTQQPVLPKLLTDLENNMKRLGIVTFGVTISSIDSVFLRAAEMFRSQTKTVSPSSIKYMHHGQDGPGLSTRRFYALVGRRFLALRRSYIEVWVLSLLTIVFSTAALCLLYVTLDAAPPVIEFWQKSLNFTDFGYENVRGFCRGNITFCGEYKRTALTYGAEIEIIAENEDDYMHRLSQLEYEMYTEHHLLGASEKDYTIPADVKKVIGNNSDVQKMHVAWFNAKAFHSYAVSINILQNTVLRQRHPNSSIDATIHTFTDENQYLALVKLRGLVFDIFIAITILMFAFMFAAPYPSVYITKERIFKGKYLIRMAGVSPINYWLSNLLVDTATLFVIYAPLWLLLPFCPRDLVYFNWKSAVALLLAIIAFILSSISLAYVCSSLFTQASTVYAAILIPSFITVAIFNFILLQLHSFNDDQRERFVWWEYTAIQVLRVICHTCPFWLLTDITSKLVRATNSIYLCDKYTKENLESICTLDLNYIRPCCLDKCGDECYNVKYNPFTFAESGACFPLLLMLIIFLACSLIVALLELRMARYISLTKESRRVQDNEPEDADVVAERKRVANLISRNLSLSDAFIAFDLTKRFKKVVVVDHLTFGIHKGECFGLLGFNGAGKTTTFRMVVGELLPTSGQAFIGRRSLQKHYIDYVGKIGYCPQFDVVFHRLTGRETLHLMANIKGINAKDVKDAVRQIISLVDLNVHADFLVDFYSGGNKRKLSLGLALIGSPKIIVLDEPTAGVDPFARRKLWRAIDTFRNTTSGSVVFSSHTMDECEALCDRLVIMRNGQFKCLGSPQYLKTKFNMGYTLFIKLENAEDFKKVDKHIRSIFPGTVIKDAHERAITYHIINTKMAISSIFKTMEKMKPKFKIDDYTVSNTSLEDVFLSFK